MINHNTDSDTSINAEGSTAYSIELNASMFTMLTKDVYNDPIKAVIREWSTNAIDACIAANNPVVFDVHLPTLDNPEFSVRDYGTGLSKSDIEGVFSVLGASTKRNSNAFNGTFGIGRLAGLACSSSYTVESFYNGKHYIYTTTVVDGIPNSVFLADLDTTEPNGLRLSIPVDSSDVNQFLKTAQVLYTFFEHKPNLNIDLNITRDTSSDISTDWYFDNTDLLYRNCNYVLMSNVVYEIPRNSGVDNKGFSRLVIEVPTGSVSINPGRESISLSKTSVEYLNKKFEAIGKVVVEKFKELVENQPTPLQKILTFDKHLSDIPYQIRSDSKIELANFLPTEFQPVKVRYHQDTFHNSTAFKTKYPNLTLVTKQSYYSTLRSFDSLSSLSRLNSTYLLDIKTKFSQISKSLDPALVLKPLDTKNMETFLTSAGNFMADFGITEHKKFSDLLEDTPETVKADRSGIYICHTKPSGLYASQKEDPAVTYWYIAASQSSPDMSTEEYTTLFELHSLLPDSIKKPLVAVQKKYLKKAISSERYLDAKEQILNFYKSQENIVTSKNLESVNTYLRSMLVRPDFRKIAPVFEYLYQETEILRSRVEKSNLFYSTVTTLFDSFKIPYTLKDTPHTVESLDITFPVLKHLTNWRLEDETKDFIIQREIIYQKVNSGELRTN